ncbi:AAA family ATPase [Isoptericola sp. b441]|uniref:AAA family ATPase n=1 Tax=Actinotalea lenta TaxID=3064654 RepID=A0ABT9DD09_9CELL|nr:MULTISPECIES: AAA family ATPase [unclassified Isoptericola]MDO8108204.1 AAA family ATPase [Isoptericola sp. b441]MDO8120124.1 AAA family ATPase [Isoptericola sp. b490]
MDANREVLAEVVLAVEQAGEGRLLVGVDGVDGVGKTTFADALARELIARGRHVVRVCLDDFLHPAAVRHARGPDSPEGFYRDSVDVDAFLVAVVRPVRVGEPIRTAVFDHRADAPIDVPPTPVPDGGVVVVDGLFLHRRELAAVWDVSVFLDAPTEVALARMAARDGTSPDPRVQRRYVQGQRLYLEECRPAHLATVVVDLADLHAPHVLPGGED